MQVLACELDLLARRVAERNADVRADVINEVFTGPDFAVRHFAETGLASYNDGDLEGADFTDYNRSYQAPSYGPLNAIVSAVAVNETLRFLLGLPTRSLGSKLLLDSMEYGVQAAEYQRNDACASCGG